MVQKSQLRLVVCLSDNPIIYRLLAPSKQWLALGFLKHQQVWIILDLSDPDHTLKPSIDDLTLPDGGVHLNDWAI